MARSDLRRPLLSFLFALAACVAVPAGCRNRPIPKPLPGTWDSTAADAATETAATATERCERPGDPCCARPGAAPCADGLVCDPATVSCVACGADGQPCCGRSCNVSLACDRGPDAPLGECTARCGLQDEPCCQEGECETGTGCSTHDETGTCKPCGLPGLKCCRGDCWIGTCAYTDAPRMCVPCGLKGQACCGDLYGGPQCEAGAICERAAEERRGTCR